MRKPDAFRRQLLAPTAKAANEKQKCLFGKKGMVEP